MRGRLPAGRAAAGCAGFTLAEVCVALALVAVLCAVAWPSYSAQLAQARRADAVAALTRLQIQQERFRAAHGLYAPDLASAGVAPRSEQALYELQLRATGPDGYLASATARPSGAAAGDAACATLTLELRDGFAHPGPSARCWNR